MLVNALDFKHSTHFIDLLSFIKFMTVVFVIIITILIATFNLIADDE